MVPVPSDTVYEPTSNGTRANPTIIFVVGLGMVGIAFIEKMLNLDEKRQYKIVTCGEETHLAYNRVGLTEFFEHRNVEHLYLNSPSWYAEQEPERFEFHTGEQITDIDSDNKIVSTNVGTSYKYDILVLATGSDASYPPYVTPEQVKVTKGLFVYRSIADLEGIISYGDKPEVTRASVMGGGLLGLEAAKAVYDLPEVPDVSIIIRQDFPLNRQLDGSAGELVMRKIEALGVKVLTRCTPKKILTKEDANGDQVFYGYEMPDGSVLESDMVIFAIGIAPRDDLAKKHGIKLAKRGGIEVNDYLMTSAEGVYAIGECASWQNNTYGLIGPGVEMADILSFNLTQTDGHAPRKMNAPDLSTKLKLMGVDVASFGDFFAYDRMEREAAAKEEEENKARKAAGKPTVRQPGEPRDTKNDSLRCLTYHDPFSATYKRFIFTADGQYLLGGMMIGDTGAYTKLVSIVKKKKKLEMPPSEFIVGAKKEGEDDGADLDDDAQICSCHNVLKGAIGACIKEGICDLADIKKKTKGGTGCGGCMPLITSIYKSEMKKGGLETNNNLCIHFAMSRQDLFNVVKVKKVKDFATLIATAGAGEGSPGCELCRPAVASILASVYNEHIIKPRHRGLQDTNDRYLGNVQRNGTFSVIPRLAGGEVTPEGLIAIGQIAKEYDLYTKITGGQRIDLFGAQKQDLPDIWEKLNKAGFESGHAYGKSLRTVKSCVGDTWCRYGVGDSVGLAIALENRYRGVRSPHKFKGGVSGCVRECAEAQSKDFGLIATDKGWNIFVCGNGGATPKHALLLAADVPPTQVTRIIDRFLMFYVRTADKLMRTARWIEQFEGGIEKLKKIILEDELGICADLDAEMDNLIDTYQDEWATAVNDPAIRKQFKQFANTDETSPMSDLIEERGQKRPADWPKNFPPQKFKVEDIMAEKESWAWVKMTTTADMQIHDDNTSSVAVKYGEDTRLAIFHVPNRGFFATQQMCPHKRFFGLQDGLIGDDKNGRLYVSCPLHKRNFTLQEGECLNDDEYSILSFEAKEENGDVSLFLPPADALDAYIGSSKWMVKKAHAEAYGKNAATNIDIVGPDAAKENGSSCKPPEAGSGGHKLDW